MNAKMHDVAMYESYTVAQISIVLQLEAAYQLTEAASSSEERAYFALQVKLLEKALSNAKIRREAYKNG